MFEMIHVEESLINHPKFIEIKNEFPKANVNIVQKYDQTWGKFKKPYLDKKDNLHLYLANKKGQLVKKAPDAYGLSGAPHFYFIHAYNCVYECQYCYLQGYFSTPDIVLFLNHEEIMQEMLRAAEEFKDQTEIWFHAGEFSDSLALSHISGELPIYFDFFKKNPKFKLELRTKSVNLKAIKKLEPLSNVIISYSLSPENVAKKIDLKTPSIKARIQTLKELQALGFKTALHLDPIIYTPFFVEEYNQLIQELVNQNLLNEIEYISLGVVRFTKDVFKEVGRNYPDSLMLAQELTQDDQLVRYSKKMRNGIMLKIQDLILKEKYPKDRIYLCMES